MYRVRVPTNRVATHIVLLIVGIGVVVQFALQDPEIRQPDEQFYLRAAHDLYHHGVFSTARARGEVVGSVAGGAPIPDNYSPPLYPAFLASVATLSSPVREAMNCRALEGEDCPENQLYDLFAVQTFFALLGLCLSMLCFRLIIDDPVFYGFAAFAVMASGIHTKLATSVLPDGLVMTAFAGFAYLFLRALKQGTNANGWWLWLAAGAAIGVSALLKPSAFYLPFILLPVMAVLRKRQGLMQGGFLVLGLVICIAPWVLRNALVLDSFAFTGSYGGFILSQRLAYNDMTFLEWMASFVFWMPDFGDRLSAYIFSPQFTERLRFDAAEGFYQVGNGPLLSQFKNLSENEGKSLVAVMIRDGVFSDPITHFLVSIPIFLRGIWIGGYFSVFAVLAVPVVLWRLHRTQEGYLLAWLTVPFALLAAFHATISINITRYNLSFVLIYGALYGVLIIEVWRALSVRWQRKSLS